MLRLSGARWLERWGARVFDVRFPVTDGPITAAIRAALLPSWSGLIVARKRPAQMPKRLITVRNDSGPALDVRSLRRYGVNVWADNSLDAENLALDAMQACRARMGPVVFTEEFSGPYEIEDDPAFTFQGNPLFHYYYAFRAVVRGS